MLLVALFNILLTTIFNHFDHIFYRFLHHTPFLNVLITFYQKFLVFDLLRSINFEF